MTAIIPRRLITHAPARRSADEWRALMRTYSRSGKTRKQFCAQHGLALSTFELWRRRLRQDFPTRGASRRSSPVQSNALFVELAEAVQPVAAASPSWDVELDLGRGVVLRLRRAAC